MTEDLSFERSLKAMLVAVVHTQVCAIRENDAFCTTFSKKVVKERKYAFPP
ncbi:MAG: hypothetical protein RBR33_04150 [Sulfurovaceae bacterium]|nr:hypothetical protein [Sulfurovaceae bacterium]